MMKRITNEGEMKMNAKDVFKILTAFFGALAIYWPDDENN